MRILHAIQGLPIAAGTTTFVVGVANESARLGHEVTVAVYCEPAPHDRALFLPSVKVVSIPSVIKTSGAEAAVYDIVHIHSMWNVWLHRVAVWCRKNGLPYVCSPHGSATPWAMRYKPWKKWTAWWLYQRNDFKRAAALHVTVPAEQEDMTRLGMKNPIIVAPLGVDLPPLKERKCRDRARKIFLFVSRIQKKKGLENLVRAVAQLRKDNRIPASRFPMFRIVGPDQENHTAELKALAQGLGVLGDFEFVGPRYGEDLASEYDRADVFILPTLSENFGVVVVDALSHALPVITTKGAPWSELETHQCGWWVDIGVEPLIPAITAAASCSDQVLHDFGSRGHQLVKDHYSWNCATLDLLNGYCLH